MGKILIKEDTDDYQGDSFVLYKKGDLFGYLCFGWGSCSGCDSLQACNSVDEVTTLANDLENSIQWFSTAEEVWKYFSSEDVKGKWYGENEEYNKFVNRVLTDDVVRKEGKC